MFTILRSLWNLTGTSAAELPRCPSYSKAMRWFELTTSQLRDFARSHDKTSYRILKRGHECCRCLQAPLWVVPSGPFIKSVCQQWSYRYLYLRFNVQTSMCWLLCYPRYHNGWPVMALWFNPETSISMINYSVYIYFHAFPTCICGLYVHHIIYHRGLNDRGHRCL